MHRNSLFSCVLPLLLLLGGCATVPVDYDRAYSEFIPATGESFIDQEVAGWEALHPGKSGFLPLGRGMDALGARLDLMDQAERTIDAQYFLMKSDDAGMIFAGKMLEAADRGVRVRFLLDDVFTSVDDGGLLLLDSHPNIQVRLFNPIARRGFYYLNFLGDFSRANRRMHNKSFIADNEVAVIGGRNIAEEYFELKRDKEFLDFDMLAVGQVARDVAVTFDRFWNHQLSVPVSAFAGNHDEESLRITRAQASAAMESLADTIYAQALNSMFIESVQSDLLTLYPARAVVVTDDPDKLLNKVSGDFRILVNSLTKELEAAESEVVIITPYLIPGEGGLGLLSELEKKGVRVVILTNSLASTNHVAVHGGYSKYRKKMLEAGVELFEARANAGKDLDPSDESGVESMTLHTKGVIIDRKITFIGSLNVDPRSIDINTEMGVMIESADLGNYLASTVDQIVHLIAYKLELDEKGKLTWHATVDGESVVEHKEPLTSGWRRFKAWFSKIVPESQL